MIFYQHFITFNGHLLQHFITFISIIGIGGAGSMPPKTNFFLIGDSYRELKMNESHGGKHASKRVTTDYPDIGYTGLHIRMKYFSLYRMVKFHSYRNIAPHV